MKPIIRASAYVTDFDSDASRISELLEVEPTRTWKKGQQIARSALASVENGWELASDSNDPLSVEAHLLDLLDRLPPKSVARLRKACPGCEVQLSITIEVESETPAVNFTPESLRRLAAIGASLDIDLYVLPPS